MDYADQMLDDVAQIAAVFERLANGEALEGMDLPQRIRDAVEAGVKAAHGAISLYFWL